MSQSGRAIPAGISLVLFAWLFAVPLSAQSPSLEVYKSYIELHTTDDTPAAHEWLNSENEGEEYPDPARVMYRSMIVPGWGQVINRQAWKIPVIYGMIGGLIWYSVELTEQYHDYRAAYYNESRGEESDFRFGPTPSHISDTVGQEQLREIRNGYRNRRDLMILVTGVAYGLNVLDAYVFAHMRSFDVSDDLSATATLSPAMVAGRAPGFHLNIRLQRNQQP
ncbi:MAG: DUF5683 domain-containing protein [Balneolaceae bacterium]